MIPHFAPQSLLFIETEFDVGSSITYNCDLYGVLPLSNVSNDGLHVLRDDTFWREGQNNLEKL
jgi:hypothetical protein